MKIGLRKPNIKKRIKARTTGKIKRVAKSTVNPLYGKKGMGYIKNPKKAVYNKVYNKTSFSVEKLFKTTGNAFIDLLFIFPIKLVYYCYKWLILGIIWLCKKVYYAFKKDEDEQMV